MCGAPLPPYASSYSGNFVLSTGNWIDVVYNHYNLWSDEDEAHFISGTG